MSLRAFWIAAVLAMSAQVLALPGQRTTPQALGLNLSLSASEARNFVYINNVQVTNLNVFQSKGGRQHLKFTMTAGGETHAAIMYQGDWTAADQQRLKAGTVHLVGIWGTFANAPSLTVRRVLTTPLAVKAAAGPTPQLLKIATAQVNVSSVKKYTSAAQKVHVTYTFNANSKTYQGVIYAGTWSSATLNLLRSGRATLYGTWGTYDDKPSFITQRVEK